MTSTNLAVVDDPSPRTVWVGTLMACGAALGYAATNAALREVAYRTDFGWAMWASCLKALPGALAAWALIGLHALRGRNLLPSRSSLGILFLTGLVMQFGGNVLFQIALSYGGLALTVPLVFASILVGGAVMGRVMLGEPISSRSALAIGLLGASVLLLSRGAEAASRSVMQETTPWAVSAAVAAACCSGLGYAFGGVMIRRCVTRQTSVAAVIMIISTMGVVALGGLSAVLIGPGELLRTSPHDRNAMLLSGVLNAGAFFAVSGALKRISVVRVNLVNASQAAMAALSGVLWFHEPPTVWLISGTALSVVGLTAIAGHREGAAVQPPENAAPPSPRGASSGVASKTCAEALS